MKIKIEVPAQEYILELADSSEDSEIDEAVNDWLLFQSKAEWVVIE